MKSSNNNSTLEENLVLTNDELLSNWTKFASLIKTYENISYDSARLKARQLLKDEQAVAYIENARKNPAGMPENKPDLPEPKPRTAPVAKPKAGDRTIFQTNYERLLKIAPQLEERLLKADIFNGKELYGKSESTGYMDFSIDLINQDSNSYYLAIAHYQIVNGDMIPDPDMVIRVDMKKMIVEALTFQDAYGYKKVYDDYMVRKLVNTREKKSQNAFLGSWLRALKTQGHKIKWKERETTGIADSELIVQYDKPTEASAKTTVETKPVKEPESRQETKGNAPSTYTENEGKEIVSAIRLMNTAIEQSEAERKAEEYKKTGKAPNFLLKVIQRQTYKNKDDLYMFNYYKLVFLVPDILQRLSNKDALLKLGSKEKDSVSDYEITQGKVHPDVIQLIVHEYSDSSEVGVLILNVKPKTNMIWVRQLAQNFNLQNDYSEQEQDFAVRYQADQWLNKWLYSLIAKQYKAVWKGETVSEGVTPEIQFDLPQVPAKPPAEDPLAEHKKRAREIPDFEVGKVQLVEAHIKAGLTQDDIDYINQHHQGMVITPRKKPMIQNTKNREMDKVIHAMKPGFRVSETGKLYYEGRSNRSDKRNTGL